MRCQSSACDWLVLREARIKLAHARGFLFCEALGGRPAGQRPLQVLRGLPAREVLFTLGVAVLWR